MKISAQGFAVLDANRDALLSRYAEAAGRLDHDAGIEVHYLPHIKPGDVVIDTGAAIGDHTVAYIRKTGDAGLVHAFECNPLMVECLTYNCPGCHIHNVALSDKHEQLFFNQIDENAGAGFVGHEPTSVPVSAVPLDSYELGKVNFIKWDLEGYEVKAINGAFYTISRCRPIMMIEVIPPQLERSGNTVNELYDLLAKLEYKYRAVIGEINVWPYFELLCEPK